MPYQQFCSDDRDAHQVLLGAGADSWMIARILENRSQASTVSSLGTPTRLSFCPTMRVSQRRRVSVHRRAAGSATTRHS